ncbi:hypothetical protein D3C71_1976430 [compost metagenome]
MAKVLELAQLVQHHGMTQVDVRRGGVQAQLDTERHPGGLAAGELLEPLGFDQQLVAATLGDLQGMHHRRRKWIFGRGGRGHFRHEISR